MKSSPNWNKKQPKRTKRRIKNQNNKKMYKSKLPRVRTKNLN